MAKYKAPKWPKPMIEFEIPLYGGWVYLYRSPEKIQQAYRYLNVQSLEDPEGLYDGFAHMLIDQSTGARLYLIGWYSDDLTTLAHEASHIAFFILSNAGIDARDSDGETFCYLLGTILEKLKLNTFNKPRKGKS